MFLDSSGRGYGGRRQAAGVGAEASVREDSEEEVEVDESSEVDRDI